MSRTITYTNPFTEKEVSEEHWFHISKADLVEMDMEEHQNRYEKDGETLTGMRAKMQRIVDAEDGKEIMATVKDLIRRAYGKREANSFKKSDAIWEEFAGTEAYSQLIWDLCTDAEASAAFMNGIIPSDLEKVVGDLTVKTKSGSPAIKAVEVVNSPIKEPTHSTPSRTLTTEQAAKLLQDDPHDFKTGMNEGRYVFEV